MIEAIERRRLALGATCEDLSRAAGLASRHYWSLLNGRKTARPATIARLKLALARLSKNPDAGGGEDRLADVAFRFAVAWLAAREGFDPSAVHAAEPARRATQDAEWMRAAKIRRLAIFALNQFGGIEQHRLARVAGMSKANVSTLIKQIFEAGDDENGELAELARAIEGGWK